MSYDIEFKARIENTNNWVTLPMWPDDLNITWNVREIITRSTGLEWKNEEDNGLVKDVIPFIQKGLHELQVNGNQYKQYEAENGWGTVQGTIEFFKRILHTWDNFCEDYDTKDLIDYAHFWIV